MRIPNPPARHSDFTDSANYLPPNSIAVAKVIVVVDAAAGVQSQTDPLPVVLRITGPARSVFDNGRLLTTNFAGCLVNGAARGDLSSEKVYVKLQRDDRPAAERALRGLECEGLHCLWRQDRGAGSRVSREGSHIGRDFLAGLAGGFGRGFFANTNTTLTGTNVNVNGQRQKLGTGDILEGGLGEGIATSGDMVREYLIERAEEYQPVIEMPTGIDVEIVFLEACSSTDEEDAMKLKSPKFSRPRLGQVLMPLAAVVLGSGGSLVWANASAAGAEGTASNAVHSPSDAD